MLELLTFYNQTPIYHKKRSFQIPLPLLEEQKLIIENLMNKQRQSEKLQENLKTQILTLEQYRKSLIHECVTGKRRITGELSETVVPKQKIEALN
jgi:type I restriction enzyme S subunit